MNRATVAVIGLGVIVAGLGLAALRLGTPATQVLIAEEDTMNTVCSDRNLDYMLRAFGDVFGITLTTDHVAQSWCVNNALGSDMFALARLNNDAPIDATQFGEPNDWAEGLIKSARSFFAEMLPAEGATLRAFSGFNEDGTSKIVVMDFGTVGHFAYFEL